MIVFLSFHSFQSTSPKGMLRLSYPLYEYLKGKESNITLFFPDPTLNGFNFLKLLLYLFIKVNYHVFDFLGIRYKITRLCQEIIFDYFCALYILIYRPSKIVSFAVAPVSLSLSKKLDIEFIFFAGNPSEYFIYNIYCNQVVYNNREIYSYRSRVARNISFEKKLENVICHTRVIYNSYKRYKCCLYYFPYVILESAKMTPDKELTPTETDFMFLSYEHKLKGLDILIKAWEEFVDNNNNTLYIGGDHKIFNIPNNVFLCGFVSNLDSFYSQGIVLIVPSLIDAGPTTIIEGLLRRKVVLASDNCGYADILLNLHPNSVFKANDSKSLLDSIEYFSLKKNQNEYLKRLDEFDILTFVQKENLRSFRNIFKLLSTFS